MTHKDKAYKLLLRIRDLANEGHVIWFSKDFGGNTLTVGMNDEHSHTDCGRTKSDNDLIDDLYEMVKFPLYELEDEK